MTALIDEARSWIGTPFRHGQSVKGSGCDCVGFIIGVGKATGMVPEEYRPPVYSAQHTLHRDDSILKAELAAFATEQPKGTPPQKGDIIVFHWARTPGHAGICAGGGTIIHASMPKRTVVEQPLREIAQYIDSVWRIK